MLELHIFLSVIFMALLLATFIFIIITLDLKLIPIIILIISSIIVSIINISIVINDYTVLLYILKASFFMCFCIDAVMIGFFLGEKRYLWSLLFFVCMLLCMIGLMV